MTDDDATGGTAGPSRRHVLAATGSVATGLLAGCLGGGSGTGNGGDGDAEDDSEMTDEEMATDWRSVELSTVRGDETFTVESLGAPVVIQSFAVWCPKCQRQSEELAGLREDLTVLGLNIDANEDAAKVRQHAEENGFDWRFAVAPAAMRDALVEAFGPTVTNAPSTPVIVACGDGSSEFMSGGINSASEVEGAADGC